MKKKQAFISFLLAALVLPSTFAHFSLQANAEETTNDTSLDVIECDTSYFKDEETGYISLPSDYEPYSEDEIITPTYASTQSSLPSSFHNYGEVISMYPATRNQNPYGTCWAFATVACAEFDLITDGTYTADQVKHNIVNFSELQLVYNMYHGGKDMLGNLGEDNSTSYNNYLKETGGSIQFAQHILANWKGLGHEDNIPYPSKANNYAVSIPSYTFTYNKMARLENSRVLDIKSNPDSVKRAIMEHGAVHASYFQHESYYSSTNSYALYYCPYSETANHSIAIVGWNDNISASNWSGSNYKPTSNGAWLIRNSWSTTNSGSNSSYFWMSYEDKSLARAVYALDFASGDSTNTKNYHYDTIYQYDGSPTHSGIRFDKIANVFTASNHFSSSGSKSETLEAITIPFSYATNVNLKIDIYTGLTNSANPQSGQHHKEATTYYTTDYKGIYTVELNKPVLLAPGEKYSIVVTTTSGDTYYDVESSTSYSNWFYTEANASEGQSFYIKNGSTWNDISTTGYGNICIKGLTRNSNIQKYTIKYNLNGGARTSDFPSGYASNSSNFTLPIPKRSGYHFVGWYTDSKMTNRITSISGSTGKNLVLYAQWGKHSCTKYITPATLTQNGLIKNKCTACGAVPSTSTIARPKSAKLAYTTCTYTGKARTPSVTVIDTNGKTISSSYYTVKYSNNKNASTKNKLATVTITFKGRYKGTVTRTFTITKKPFTKVNLAYTSCTYTGKARTPSVSVYVGSKKISKSYYSVSYKNNKNAGTATVIINGKGKYANYSSKKTFKINPVKFTKASTVNSGYCYTGTARKPPVNVYVGKKKLSSSNYSLSYKNNVNIGTATVTITGKGSYANYRSTVTFSIVPKKQSINLETRGYKGRIYCTQTYDDTCDEYYAQVSDSSSFKKVITDLKMNNGWQTWYAYNLTSNKTYYVRVRSQKTINGKTYYGPWSAVKSIKTL